MVLWRNFAINELDFRILRILNRNADLPFAKISTELGVSIGIIKRRYEKMQKMGLIQGTTIVLSSRAFGFTELAGFWIKVKSGSDISTVTLKLENIPQIHSISQQCGGVFDFYVECFMKNFSDVHNLIETIRGVKEITKIAPIFFSPTDWPLPYNVDIPRKL